jgi:hypothetical protein
MPPSGEQWIEEYKGWVQPRVPEPVISVGFLHPAGAVSNIGVGRLSPALGFFRARKSNQNTGGLAKITVGSTQQACLVLTADRLYAFAYASGTRGKTGTVGEQLEAWPRSDVRITTKAGRLTTRVELDIATTGKHYELECMTTAGNAGTSQLFLQELTSGAV